MKICAIILDYRGAARTSACLQALFRQGIETILVVDNSESACASTELDIALDNLRVAHPDYTLHTLRPKQNLGFAKGVNLAFSHDAAAACDHFLLINNDALASPGMVMHLASSMQKNGSDMIAPQILDEQGNLQPMFWYQRHFGLLTHRPLPGSFPYLSGCCLLFRRDLLRNNQLFDEDFFMYGEDTLLGWQLRCGGKTFSIDHGVNVRHEGGGSSQRYGLFYEFHIARAHVLLALKAWNTRFEVPFLLVGKFLFHGLRAMMRCTRARSIIPLMAFVLAWSPVKLKKVQ